MSEEDTYGPMDYEYMDSHWGPWDEEYYNEYPDEDYGEDYYYEPPSRIKRLRWFIRDIIHRLRMIVDKRYRDSISDIPF